MSLSEFFVQSKPQGGQGELFCVDDKRTFDVREIRSARGMLLIWLDKVHTVPDERANGTSLKWRQLAVRPDPLSGAYGAFAAVDDRGQVTLFSLPMHVIVMG